MGLNVSNMPLNTLYKFDDNRYVISFMLDATRNHSYPLNKPKRFTEVYQVDANGVMTRVVSGDLINKPDVYDFDKMFSIKDCDMDQIFSFKINKPFHEVELNELYKLRDAVNNNKKINK